MSENREKSVLVLGATGRQGGATARELIKKGFSVRTITRKPDSEEANDLSKLGASVVQADITDDAAMEAALEGAWGVFSVLTMVEAGVKWEEEQGIKVAEMARKAGVEHFVYSSVASANKNTGIPHFESKWHIEEKVRSLNFPFYTIIRPVSFMENLLNPATWSNIEKGTLVMGLRPDAKQQLIAVGDIGRFASLAFEQPEKTNRQEIDIAGDEMTANEMAMILEKTLGRDMTVMPVNLEEARRVRPDFAMMVEWMDKYGYNVDIHGLVKKWGIRPVTFAQFAAGLKIAAKKH